MKKLSFILLLALCSTVAFAQPAPKISLSVSGECSGSAVTFTNNTTISSGGVSYKWLFGNGDSTLVTSPSYVYSSQGTYTVSLTATSNMGVSADTTFTLVIKESPSVNFSTKNACEGLAVEFINKTTSSGGTITYNWIFEGGGMSTAENPSYTFLGAGTFPVILEATLNGCTSTVIKPAIQFESPKPMFSSPGGCFNEPITFTNTSTVTGGGSVGAFWDFNEGDGVQTGNPINHTFDSAGTKTVKIIAISQFGCKDSANGTVDIKDAPIADFTYDQICDATPTQFENLTHEPTGVAVSYDWDFGDGRTSMLENPSNQYTFTGPVTVELSALGINGCKSSESKTLTVGKLPIAMFEAGTGCNGQELLFSNTTLSNVVGTVFKWHFGDGDSSDAMAPTHIYTTDSFKSILVTLNARKDDCQSDFSKLVNLEPSPDCNFTATQSSSDLAEYTFTPDSTDYKLYIWTFDNSGSSNQPAPTFTFPIKNKLHAVTVGITSFGGCNCTSDTVNVFSGISSVNERLLDPSIAIYPNPTSDVLTVNYPSVDLNYPVGIKMFDLSGVEVISISDLTFVQGSYILDIQSFKSGTYLIEVTNGNRFKTEKVVINQF